MIVFLVVVAAVVVLMVFGLWKYYQRSARFEDLQSILFLAGIEAQENQEREKILRCRPLLTGKSWRDPDGKAEFIHQLYDGCVPAYLWYALGDARPFEDELEIIKRFFFDGQTPGGGNLELHISGHKDVGVALRVRFAKNIATEITVGGQLCPLHQTGHAAPFGNGTGQPCANFIRIFRGDVSEKSGAQLMPMSWEVPLT